MPSKHRFLLTLLDLLRSHVEVDNLCNYLTQTFRGRVFPLLFNQRTAPKRADRCYFAASLPLC
jgi:hypothetical protein